MPEDPYRLSGPARLRVWAAPAILIVRDLLRDCVEDIPLLTRIASHVGLLFLMLVTIAASNIRFNTYRDENVNLSNSDSADPFLANEFIEDELSFPAAIPITNVPMRTRQEVVKYPVQAGDTVSGIAEQFDVSGDSILWANPKLEDNPDMLSIGQTLNIPPATGVLYTVLNGDNLQKIADKFKSKKTPADQLIQNILKSEYNQEVHDIKGSDYVLTTGQFLMVPGGAKPYVARVVHAIGGPIPSSAARGTGHFGWPVSGRITQGFGIARHTGVDIGAPKGTPVVAADSGYVVAVGCVPTGYGCSMLINHGNGFSTRYAHLSSFIVDAGSSVKKGQLIARVGNTGNSTGPHLHFEIIQSGVIRNPFGLLPGR
ncbi:MAG: M23 family metallopeptidase [Chloroflexi bacterium]|nr:M23 family metallopeptidase [Chloroflexota bacterium]